MTDMLDLTALITSLAGLVRAVTKLIATLRLRPP